MEQNQNQPTPEFDQLQDQQPMTENQKPYVPIMKFWEAVKTCFRKYFDFKGRARRSEYWWFVLFTGIVCAVWSFLSVFISMFGLIWLGSSGDGSESTVIVTILATMLIPMLFLIIPQYAATTRRLHDTGRSGWWVVLSLVVSFAYLGAYIKALMPMWDQMEQMTGPSSAFSQAQVIANTFHASPAFGVLLCILMLASIAITITMLVFEVQDSHEGTNQYGPSPKYP